MRHSSYVLVGVLKKNDRADIGTVLGSSDAAETSVALLIQKAYVLVEVTVQPVQHDWRPENDDGASLTFYHGKKAGQQRNAADHEGDLVSLVHCGAPV